MGMARPITGEKSDDSFIRDYSFLIDEHVISLRCLIDTGADSSLVDFKAVSNYSRYFLDVHPMTFRSLTSSFQTNRIIKLSCMIEFQKVEHEFYISFDEFQRMPFDVIIGKDLLTRLNASIVFSRNVCISSNGPRYDSMDDALDEEMYDTDLDRNEVYLPTHETSFNDVSIEDKDIYSLLLNYKENFSNNCGRMSSRFALDLRLSCPTQKAIAVPPRKVPMHYENEVRKQIKDLVERGLIQPTDSRFTFPVVLAKKKNGDLRMCIDFKELNKATIKESDLLPQFEELRNRLGGASIFSAIDFSQGYWHIPLSEESQRMVCFSPGPGMGNFSCKVMPFGLTQAPGHFQRVMNKIFGDLPYVFVYIDDLLIFSENKEQHMRHIKEVFDRIESAGLHVKSQKCSFGVAEVSYLGHVFSNGKYHYNKKTKHLFSEYPLPVTVKDLETFIGTANYYRKFVPNFSTLLKPLYDFKGEATSQLLTSLSWNTSLINSFNEVCNAIINATPLKLPDRNQQFTLQSDASDYGIGVTLLQNGIPISYASRLLKKAELRYSTYEKELLAVIFGCKTFRDCLLGKKFILNTDHQPLIWLQSQKLSGRLGRWIIALREYDFVAEHIRGVENTVADRLSRKVCAIIPDMIVRDWSQIQVGDSELSHFLNGSDHISSKLYKPYSKHFSVNNGILYFKRDRIVVPKSEISLLLSDTHISLGHCGLQRMLLYLKSRYFWPDFYSSIRDFAKGCMTCSMSKSYKKCRFPEFQYCGNLPFEKVSMDLKVVSPHNGYHYILVIQDTYSRFVNFYALKKKTPECVLEKFQQFICNYGKPMSVLTDEGTEFKGSFDSFCRNFKIFHPTSSPYHHSGNGMAERTNRWLEERLIMNLQGWPDRLYYWQFLFNQFANNATGVSPNYLVFSYEPVLLFDNYSQIVDSRSSSHHIFKVGDFVLIKNENRLKQKPYYLLKKFKIIEIRGSTAIIRCLNSDFIMKRHFSQIKKITNV